MYMSRSILSATAIALTLAACSTHEAKRFAVEVDDGIFINNAIPIVDASNMPETPGIFMGTVLASEIDCTQMPCDNEVRAAKEQAYLDLRRAPPGADVSTY